MTISPSLVSIDASDALFCAAECILSGNFTIGERLLEGVLTAIPNDPTALHLKGASSFRQGNIIEGCDLMDKAYQLGATALPMLTNLAEVYRVNDRLEDAQLIIMQALNEAGAKNFNLNVHYNASLIFYDSLEIDKSIYHAQVALHRSPQDANLHFQLAKSYLVKGDLLAGWQEYEWRYKITGASSYLPSNFQGQLWKGENLEGERLLLIADQGYGDTIMFARYLTWVATRCPNIIIACEPTIHLVLSRMFPQAHYINRWDTCPSFRAYNFFSGLPGVHQTTVETIPSASSYLKVDPYQEPYWRQRLSEILPADKLKVGIVWSGRPTHTNDKRRSVHLETLAPLLNCDNISVVSLQKGPAAEQIQHIKQGYKIIDLNNELHDFDDTMAVLSDLDLLISVDTGVAHFAAALGVKTWILLPYAPDWRWLLSHEHTTPWYPSVQLFRQSKAGDWAEPINRIIEALKIIKK